MDAQANEDVSGSTELDARAHLVERMVGELRSRGYFLTHIDSRAGQVVIDVRWAAQLAGRAVGRRTRTYATAVGKRLPGMITVIVAPVETWSTGEVRTSDGVPAFIAELLDVHSHAAGRRPA